MMWRCQKCETYNNGERCVVCHDLKTVYAPPPPTYKPPVYSKPASRPTEEKSKGMSILGGIVVAVLVALFFIVMDRL